MPHEGGGVEDLPDSISSYLPHQINITAANYFGARNAIETLFQLVEYDDITNNYIMMGKASILDYPEYQHRGIMLDTSRNFIQTSVIKRIIDGMAHSKVCSECCNIVTNI